jgi:vanillate O-demethylase ferredoxin subunit
MYDCKKGECGLCQVDVLEYSGDIDHRDLFFSEEEKGKNNKLCACVSRVANGHIVIDTAYRSNI